MCDFRSSFYGKKNKREYSLPGKFPELSSRVERKNLFLKNLKFQSGLVKFRNECTVGVLLFVVLEILCSIHFVFLQKFIGKLSDNRGFYCKRQVNYSRTKMKKFLIDVLRNV